MAQSYVFFFNYTRFLQKNIIIFRKWFYQEKKIMEEAPLLPLSLLVLGPILLDGLYHQSCNERKNCVELWERSVDHSVGLYIVASSDTCDTVSTNLTLTDS